MITDIRYALRALARDRLFTLGAVATLALGIGVNSTIFTLANGALFRGMPGLSEPERLAWVSAVMRTNGRAAGLSYPDYADTRDATGDVFGGLAAFRPTPISLASGGDPQRVRGHLITGSYFETLGVIPAAGRFVNDADDGRGAAAAVAVISYRLWQQRFGGSADLLRQTIIINGRACAIVGVAPRGFSGPALGEGADVWLPMSLWPALHAAEARLLDERGSAWLMVVGRLRPGVSMARAQASLLAVSTRLEQVYPDTNRDRILTVAAAGSPLSPQGRAELVPLSVLLLTVTALVLLIACANIANLLLARGAARAAEIGIRAAIGATRGRLVRQLLTESALLAAAGAGAGLLLSFWGADFIRTMLPADDFQGLTAAADGRVLLFTAALTAASVSGFGLVPALSATRRSLLPSLRQAGGSGARSRLQGLFVVAQLSLSLVLLLGAGLSLRALQNAAAIDLGFNPRGVLAASYDLVLQNYPADRRDAFRRELAARVSALPGVVSVTLANVAPLSGTMVGTLVSSAGTEAAESMAYVNAVGPEYFRALEIPLVRGRAIAPIDTRGGGAVAVVNQTLARRLWGPSDAIGQSLRMGDTSLQVIGVARDAKYDEATEDPRPFLYTALGQHPMLDRETIMVRTASPSASLGGKVQAIVRALDPAMPVFDVQPLEAGLRQRSDKQRAISALVAAFGLLALVLAAIGLYGVMAYTVARRRREMGVRLALGATPSQLTRLIATDGLRLAAAGVAIGSLLALPLAQALGALVFGVAIGDVAGFAAACGLLIVVAIVAAVLPARRAGRLDPIAALRVE